MPLASCLLPLASCLLPFVCKPLASCLLYASLLPFFFGSSQGKLELLRNL
ncbi:hypothetical protein [Moorena sp. SIO3H5]|nr:hypothetical protein [Moorena sp. SIO3H5]